uniref:Uncharacterized protein n=1 Tax=Oryza nivara TaxID=4536 RepID=A0A0E0H2A4_ORYNI
MTPLPRQRLLARFCRYYSTRYGSRYASHHLPANCALAAAVRLLSSQITSSHRRSILDPLLHIYIMMTSNYVLLNPEEKTDKTIVQKCRCCC